MEQKPNASSIAALTAFILISFVSIPTLLKLFKSLRARSKLPEYSNIQELYEDEDGAATEVTRKEFSAALPKYLALSSVIIGFLASITYAIVVTILPLPSIYVEKWLMFGSWVLGTSTRGELNANRLTVASGH